MSEFDFSLTVAGINTEEDGFEDRLYEAGCDDALVSVVKGSLVLDFTREAKNFVHAVGAAISDVQTAGGRVVRVEPDSLATVGDIATRTGISRQYISLLAAGKRGHGFPPPVARVHSDSPLWDFHDVARWLCANQTISDRKMVIRAAIIRGLNTALDHYVPRRSGLRSRVFASVFENRNHQV